MGVVKPSFKKKQTIARAPRALRSPRYCGPCPADQDKEKEQKDEKEKAKNKNTQDPGPGVPEAPGSPPELSVGLPGVPGGLPEAPGA